MLSSRRHNSHEYGIPISAQLSHGAFALRPPQAGSYYCVLDSTYSMLTSKVVDVSASLMCFEDARFRFIEKGS